MASFLVRVGDVPKDPGNPLTPDRSTVVPVVVCHGHRPTLPLGERVTGAATPNGKP